MKGAPFSMPTGSGPKSQLIKAIRPARGGPRVNPVGEGYRTKILARVKANVQQVASAGGAKKRLG